MFLEPTREISLTMVHRGLLSITVIINKTMSHNGYFRITDPITEMGVLKGICNEASTEQKDKTLLISFQGLRNTIFSSPKN